MVAGFSEDGGGIREIVEAAVAGGLTAGRAEFAEPIVVSTREGNALKGHVLDVPQGEEAGKAGNCNGLLGNISLGKIGERAAHTVAVVVTLARNEGGVVLQEIVSAAEGEAAGHAKACVFVGAKVNGNVLLTLDHAVLLEEEPCVLLGIVDLVGHGVVKVDRHDVYDVIIPLGNGVKLCISDGENALRFVTDDGGKQRTVKIHLAHCLDVVAALTLGVIGALVAVAAGRGILCLGAAADSRGVKLAVNVEVAIASRSAVAVQKGRGVDALAARFGECVRRDRFQRGDDDVSVTANGEMRALHGHILARKKQGLSEGVLATLDIKNDVRGL